MCYFISPTGYWEFCCHSQRHRTDATGIWHWAGRDRAAWQGEGHRASSWMPDWQVQETQGERNIFRLKLPQKDVEVFHESQCWTLLLIRMQSGQCQRRVVIFSPAWRLQRRKMILSGMWSWTGRQYKGKTTLSSLFICFLYIFSFQISF